MFKVKNYDDLRLAYELLEYLKEDGKTEKVIEYKRKIRQFVNRPVDDERIIKYSESGDYYIALLPLPEDVATEDEAMEYFEDYEYIHCRPSAYDCTGQAFTSWYKVFMRNGKFYAYHSVCFDV